MSKHKNKQSNNNNSNNKTNGYKTNGNKTNHLSNNNNSNSSHNVSNKWQPIAADISATNKAKVRRIEFHKATKPSTAFNTVNNSSPINTLTTTTKTNNATTSNNNDATASPNPGLFDPSIVQKYLKWMKVARPGPGLYNHGNTCYLNSTLQCLLHTASLTQSLLNEEKIILNGLNKFGDNRTITQFFHKLVKEAWSLSPGKSISPRSMVQNIRRVGKQFKPMRQEDAHEYLRLLLDCMHEEILKANKVSLKDGKIAETTVISRVFGGYLCNELKCSECSYSSKTFNHFQDLSVEVSHQKLKSVNDAINAFIKAEILSNGNEWKCDGCKNKVKAKKQMTVYKAPNVLVLHLKRFSFGNMFGKITKIIEFGPELYLPCSGEETSKVKYELSSMIVHHGSSVHGGHYVAFIKAPNGQWYEMNDSHVSATSVQTVLKQQAYVLFYTRVASDPVETQSKPNINTQPIDKDIPKDKPIQSLIKTSEVSSILSSTKVGIRLKPRLFSVPTPLRWRGPLFKFFKQSYSPFKGLLRNGTGTKKAIKINFENDSDDDDKDYEEGNDDEEEDGEDDEDNMEEDNNDEDDNNDFNNVDKFTNDDILKKLMRKNGGTVGHWDIVPTSKLNEIEVMARKQQRSEQNLLGSRQISEWDKELDKGRTKKVKIKTDEMEEEEEDRVNLFQKAIETRKREDTYQNDKSRMKKRRR